MPKVRFYRVYNVFNDRVMTTHDLREVEIRLGGVFGVGTAFVTGTRYPLRDGSQRVVGHVVPFYPEDEAGGSSVFSSTPPLPGPKPEVEPLDI